MRGALPRILLAVALLAGVVAVADAAAAPARVVAHGSVEQVYATGLAPRVPVTLLNAKGRALETRRATAEGGVLFRELKPGPGYRIRVGSATSAPVTVRTKAVKPWDTSYQKQSMPYKGYGYLTTRDGTKLAYTVHPPTRPAGLGTPDVTLPPGAGPLFAPPYPTLIEYSGYGYANPDGPQSGIAVLANAMGFAVVDINMRGSGCSGGAFSFFEWLQSLDGYDIVETVARQPWVKNHKVGMMGISYGGISQLFTAQTQPPSLAAISPLSVIDATPTTLYPGGILNTGFAVEWAKERQASSLPSGPGKGQPWAWERIQAGDQTCKANQALHAEAADLQKQIRENTYYNPSFVDPLDPVTFVNKIKVPTFMACQWQDEQTGGHCPALVRNFTGTKKKWFTFTNGAHIDSLDPATYVRWFDFLNLYVAKQAPALTAAVTAAASPVVYQEAMGLPQDSIVTMPPDPIWAEPTYESALAAFEKLPSVRVLFDNGAGKGPLMQARPGDPYAGFEQSFSTFPVPGTTARTWYFGAKGSLVDRAGARGIDVYTANPKALPLTNFTGGTGGGALWGNASQWSWNWKPNPSGTAVSYVTSPLKTDTTVVGAGAVTAWVRSSAPDVDLQVTVSEVDPSGHETFVQNGYLRASYRKLATGTHTILGHPSTLLEPVPSFLKRDNRPMPKNAFTKVVVPLYYQGHAYRAGTRIRVTIAAPNGAQPVWSFKEPKPALGRTSTVSIAFSPTMPSSIVLPVIPGIDIPTAQPACPSLRSQPCRTYVPLVNRRLAG